jgi:hypothetical protein
VCARRVIFNFLSFGRVCANVVFGFSIFEFRARVCASVVILQLLNFASSSGAERRRATFRFRVLSFWFSGARVRVSLESEN